MKKTRLEIYNDFPSSIISTTIDEWIHDERNRRILKYKLIHNYSYERIAEIEELSSKQVQNIVYKAEDILFKHIILVYKPQ